MAKFFWSSGEDVKKLDHLYTSCGSAKDPSGKQIGISYKTEHSTTIQHSTCCLGPWSQRKENYVHTKTFITVIFIIETNWKQLWYIHMEYKNSNKQNKLLS